jgi:K+-transporting ATPase ATPase C chain
MIKILIRSTLATLILAVILCGVYPLLVYGIGLTLFSEKSKGDLILSSDGHFIGAKLIGQNFTKPEYFHGRPSAAGNGYDAANSSGSNLGPTNQKFADGLKANIDTVLKDNPSLKKGEIPVDLVTASASGLDPHISPDGAFAQLARVAKARGISEEELRTFVEAHVTGPELGIFGESVVNVLMINIDLDKKYPKVNKS